MKDEYLTLGEVAIYLGWTHRFVERLAVNGRLPGTYHDGHWRFQRSRIIEWLDEKMQTLDASHVTELERHLHAELTTDGLFSRPEPAVLTSHLHAAGIELAMAAADKSSVLGELVAVSRRTGLVSDARLLGASILERESLCSTALPGGVAIVHPRRPLPGAVREMLLCFGRTVAPVAFGAEDGEPTQLFFLLVALGERRHLHALARLVRLLRGSTLDALRAAPDAASVVSVLHAREAALDAHPITASR